MSIADTSEAAILRIFHNPRCSKSRQALALLESSGRAVEVVEYLNSPPNRRTLSALTEGYDGPAVDLVRTDDPAFAALGVDPATLDSVGAVVDLLVEHPEVMQRPLVVRGESVVIGRPPDRVRSLFA